MVRAKVRKSRSDGGFLRPAPVVGIIGQIGAGKSEVARLLAQIAPRAVIISGDDIGHQVVDGSRAVQLKLARAFGRDILVSGGGIHRHLVAARAFATPEGHETLNDIVHPPLLRELRRQIRAARRGPKVDTVIVDAALLVEWGQHTVGWDFLIGVSALKTVRFDRLLARGWSQTEIKRRTMRQIPWAEKRGACLCIIENNRTRAHLRHCVKLCWQKASARS